MKFMTILLKEGRREDLIKKYSDKFSEEGLNNVMTDPVITHTSYKYADFVLKHLNPNYSTTELSEVMDALKKFDKIQSRLEKKDINQYTGFFDFITAINEYTKTNEKPKSKKIYEDDKFIVVEPQNYIASCKYGSKTRWCTTAKDNDSHFNNYTSGNQGLYYVISKRDLEENLYKIAIHFDRDNKVTIYDASDETFPKKMIALFKSAYPELWKAIEDYHEGAHPDDTISIVQKELSNPTKYTITEELPSIQKKIILQFQGLEIVESNDKNFMVINEVKIYGYPDKDGSHELLDEYLIQITAQIDKSFSRKSLSIDWVIGATGEETKVDLGLDGMDGSMSIIISDGYISSRITKVISNNIFNKLRSNQALRSYYKAKPTWTPDRIGYGYTFAKNKGLIKKLVAWLGDSKIGTKLDFLVDVGKLDKKIENNKPLYSIKGNNDFRPSSDLRGHFASFFASAKMAGILDYRKVGTQFYMKKGPNYDAFVSGELRAL